MWFCSKLPLATIHTAYSKFIATLFEKFETVLEERKFKNSNWIPFEWWNTVAACTGREDSRNKCRHSSLFKHFSIYFWSKICRNWSEIKRKQQVELKFFWKEVLFFDGNLCLTHFIAETKKIKPKVLAKEKPRKTRRKIS